MINYAGDPLYVGFDLTIASFDSISEVSMVRIIYIYQRTDRPKRDTQKEKLA